MLFYTVMKPLVQVALRIFFRRIEVRHPERLLAVITIPVSPHECNSAATMLDLPVAASIIKLKYVFSCCCSISIPARFRAGTFVHYAPPT